MDEFFFQVSTFCTVRIAPGQTVKVTIPQDSTWEITSVSIAPVEPLPTSGRVVVYASSLRSDGSTTEKVAIAPLRIGAAEVINVNYSVSSATQMLFSTSGDSIGVTINGNTTTSKQLVIESV
jgi:hypothetical protein